MQNGTHRNGTSNGVAQDAAVINEHELLWDGLPPAVVEALRQPLDPALVSRRRGRAGRVYDYIEGHTAIDEANAIFGFGGWGYELAGDVALRVIETADPKTGEVRVSRAYSAPVRVTVNGAPPRTDVGFHAVVEESAEGHETALKGAVTDGMKRALRSFGDRFGNALYGGPPPETPAGGKAAGGQRNGNNPTLARAATAVDDGGEAARAQELRTRLIALSVEQGFDEEQTRAAVRAKTGRELDALPASALSSLVEGAQEKLRRMRESRAA